MIIFGVSKPLPVCSVSGYLVFSCLTVFKVKQTSLSFFFFKTPLQNYLIWAELIQMLQYSLSSHSNHYALITGHHPPGHGGEDPHALSDVRYSNLVWKPWGEVGSRGLLCGPTWRRRSALELSWLNGALQVVWKRSHPAGRWLKPLSHGDGEVLVASEEENTSVFWLSLKQPFLLGEFEVLERENELGRRKRYQ